MRSISQYSVERPHHDRGAAPTRDLYRAFTPSGHAFGLCVCRVGIAANRHIPVHDMFAGSGRARMEKWRAAWSGEAPSHLLPGRGNHRSFFLPRLLLAGWTHSLSAKRFIQRAHPP
jgi:hypothetical protein